MLKYKILIKLFVLNCVFVCCLYDGTIQVEVVVCLLLSRDQQRQPYGTSMSVNMDGCTGPSRSNAKHQITPSRGSAQRQYFKKWLVNTHRSCGV